jgi:hypothetical protein
MKIIDLLKQPEGGRNTHYGLNENEEDVMLSR